MRGREAPRPARHRDHAGDEDGLRRAQVGSRFGGEDVAAILSRVGLRKNLLAAFSVADIASQRLPTGKSRCIFRNRRSGSRRSLRRSSCDSPAINAPTIVSTGRCNDFMISGPPLTSRLRQSTLTRLAREYTGTLVIAVRPLNRRFDCSYPPQFGRNIRCQHVDGWRMFSFHTSPAVYNGDAGSNAYGSRAPD